jgi:hypothetical protein
LKTSKQKIPENKGRNLGHTKWLRNKKFETEFTVSPEIQLS